MRAIFISYRRNDSEGEAGRLLDDLVEQFGENSVFMDVTAIDFGRDFRKAIDESVATCGVLLAIIGNNWVDAKNEAGLRRLDDPADFVRLETAAALRRDIPVIPVLVRGARMPRPEQLPDDLKDLAYRNGVELTHARWGSDRQLLIKALRPYIGTETSQSGTHAAAGASLVDRPSESAGAKPSLGPPAVRRRETKWLAMSAGLMVALALGGYGTYYFKGERERQALELQRSTTDAERRRAEAERAELDQKKTDLEKRAAQLAADRAAADKAEADRRRDAAQAARMAPKPAESQKRSGLVKQVADITMEKGGIIKIEFFPDDAPKTVENFITLAKKGFYDGLTFHRVEPNFVVQGGDPKGDGTGGPGYKVKAEFNKQQHVRGAVAMARSQDPDSAGSQFYITLAPAHFLDDKYTVFGKVTSGMNIVDNIKKGDKMKSVKIIETAE
jgi:cyclophilin family peptidyl-prolyl cis-trans isomerase